MQHQRECSAACLPALQGAGALRQGLRQQLCINVEEAGGSEHAQRQEQAEVAAAAAAAAAASSSGSASRAPAVHSDHTATTATC